jgi:hypothetical protein
MEASIGDSDAMANDNSPILHNLDNGAYINVHAHMDRYFHTNHPASGFLERV